MLVLASSSPRRRELLQKWGYCFEIVDAAASEIVPYGSSPAEAVMAIAGRKALAGLGELAKTRRRLIRHYFRSRYNGGS